MIGTVLALGHLTRELQLPNKTSITKQVKVFSSFLGILPGTGVQLYKTLFLPLRNPILKKEAAIKKKKKKKALECIVSSVTIKICSRYRMKPPKRNDKQGRLPTGAAF